MSNISKTRQLSSRERILIALKEARSKIEALERAKTEPIAIIGMGCRLPGGADNPDAFWQLLCNGEDAIGEVPKERWNIDQYYDPDPDAKGKMYTRLGGFLSEVDQFDPEFFGISPREARSMDPQQRLLLEVAWEALEHAGQMRLRGSQTGIFMGISTHDYEQNVFSDTSSIDAYAGLGNAQSIAVGRLAYVLGVHGPTFQLDTACSSSLLAIHLAVMSLRAKECDMALAGGVNLMLSPLPTIFFCKTRALSPDGRCKTFDARANGYSRGEGCAIVVLKRLSDALRDKDNILAVIRGSAVNHDGPSSGLTVPNRRAQESLIQKALKNGKVKPSQVSYVEAHGTGTPLGDPIELGALAEVLTKERSASQPLIVGSLKTNIGHLEAAAGVASLIKVVLALQHDQIPPHLHFQEPNPLIDWDKPLKVPTELTPWPQGHRLAGVSSFGFSGTNVHVILEAAKADNNKAQLMGPTQGDRPLHLLTLSAKTERALHELVAKYETYLATTLAERCPEPVALRQAQEPGLADICFTANTGRRHFKHRLAVVGADKAQMAAQLATFNAGDETSGLFEAPVTQPPQVAFLFTGQGSQYVGMGQELYETQPTFRQVIDKCDELLQPYLSSPLLSVLYSTSQHVVIETYPDEGKDGTNQPTNQPTNQLNQTAYTQVALFALEYALAKLWESWGVVPDVVMGHSVGELVAACVAGVFSLEDGLKLVAERGRLMQSTAPGEMVAIFAPEASVASVIGAIGTQSCSIAAINGPQLTVISGTRIACEQIVSHFEREEIRCQPLTVGHAFHSPLMEPILSDFRRVAQQVRYSEPKISLLSNVTGTEISTEVTKPEYWVRHIRQPVRFADSMNTLIEQGIDTFVEIGPKPTLLGMGRRIYAPRLRGETSGSDGYFLPSLRPANCWSTLLSSAGQLYVRGVEIDWVGFHKIESGSERSGVRRHARVVLPTYPFQRKRYWVETETTEASLMPLLGKKLHSPSLGATVFESHFSTNALPFLLDHRIYEKVVVPGACHISLLLEASAKGAIKGEIGEKECLLEDILFRQALVLPEGEARTVQLVMTRHASVVPKESETSFELISFDSDTPPSQNTPWVVHATGRLSTPVRIFKAEPLISIQKIKARCQEELSQVELYQALSLRQIEFGPSFRWIESIWSGDREAICKTKVPAPKGTYQLHPGLIDSCFQLLAATFSSEPEEVLVPFNIERFRFLRRPNGQELWCHARLRQEASSTTGDIQLFNSAGQIIAKVVGLTFRKAPPKALLRSLLENSSEWLYEIAWEVKELRAEKQSTKVGCWLILADEEGIGTQLARQLSQQGERCVLAFAGHDYQKVTTSHYRLNPAAPEEVQRLIKTISESEPIGQIVHLWSLEEPDHLASGALTRSVSKGCGSVLHLVQALVSQEVRAGLWLVTRGAQSVAGSDIRKGIWQAPLWGLGRVIAQEHPEFKCVCLDLAPSGEPNQREGSLIVDELCSKDGEDQVAFRNGERYVARLVRARPTVSPRLTEQSSDRKRGASLALDGAPGLRSSRSSVRREGTYLITGGLGALGMQVANFLVAQGVRHLLLTGRRGAASPEAQEAVRQLEQKGALVTVVKADVSKINDVSRLLEAAGTSLRGVIHAAGVLDDGVLTSQSLQRFEKVMAPKVQGAWNLHQLTREIPLDFFVLFSSVASLLGSAGQANYAAANAFMDGLAHYRHALGLPALSINWGPWAETGMAAHLASRLKVQGISMIAPEDGLQVLGKLFKDAKRVPQVGVLPVEWSKFMAHQKTPFFSTLVPSSRSSVKRPVEGRHAPQKGIAFAPASSGDIYEILLAAPADERRSLLMEHLRAAIGQVMGLGSDIKIEPHERLFDLGLDSLMAVELKNLLESNLRLPLRSTLLFNYPTLSKLADYLAKEVLPAELSSEPFDQPPDHQKAQTDKSKKPELPDIARRLAQKLETLD